MSVLVNSPVTSSGFVCIRRGSSGRLTTYVQVCTSAWYCKHRLQQSGVACELSSNRVHRTRHTKLYCEVEADGRAAGLDGRSN